MRASKNTAVRNGFCVLLLRTDESARVYAPAERWDCPVGHPQRHQYTVADLSQIQQIQTKVTSVEYLICQNLGRRTRPKS